MPYASFNSTHEQSVDWKPPRRVRANTAADKTPIPVSLPLFPKQLEFVESTTRITAMVGGIGSGKTFALMAYIAKAMYRERGRGTLGGIFANTNKQLTQSTLPKLWTLLDDTLGFQFGRDYVFGQMPPKSWGAYPSAFKQSHDGVLSIRWWGQLIVRSLENEEAIRGVELGYAGIDEARGTGVKEYHVVLGRIRCARATSNELRIATSPNGFNWLYEEMVERPSPIKKLIQASTDDNPTLPPDYVTSLRASYDELNARQELGGEFLSLTQGRAYREFDRATHVRAIKPDPSMDWQVSFDFNRTPYCVVIFQTYDKGNVRQVRVNIVHEIRLMDADTWVASREVVQWIRSHMTAANPNSKVEVYGDPSGRKHLTNSTQSDFDIIEQVFKTEFGQRYVEKWALSDPGILARVSAVNALFRNSLGDVRLYVHEGCRHVIKDFEQVAFKTGTRELDKSTDRMITHLSDCVAYYVHERYPAIHSPAIGGVSA